MTHDAREIATQLRPAVFRLARMLRQQDDGHLSPTLGQALVTIALEGPITLKQLAQREQLSPPSITKVVERLEAEQLIARETDAADRRVCRVRITARGRRRLEQNRARRTEWLTERFMTLDDDELATLAHAAAILTRLTEA